MKNIFLIITALVFIIAGCASAEKSMKLDYTIYNSDKNFSKPLRGAKIFNSADEYNDFLMARAMKKASVLKDFDFINNSLLVVYLGREADEGRGLDIKSVTEEDEILVTATMTDASASKSPQYFLTIKKTDKKAKLIIE